MDTIEYNNIVSRSCRAPLAFSRPSANKEAGKDKDVHAEKGNRKKEREPG